MKGASRQEQVRAMLTVMDIPMRIANHFTRTQPVHHDQPYLVVSEYLMSSDHTAYQLSKPTILIELRGLGGGFHVLDQDDGTDDPFDRTDIIERFVNKLDNRKLGRLSKMLCNLVSNT